MNNLQQEERDLLIELRTEMRAVREDIKLLSDNISARLLVVEKTKLDKEEADRLLEDSNKLHKDHETRIRFLERYVWGALGVLAAGQVATEVLLK